MLTLRYRLGLLVVALIAIYLFLTFVVTPPNPHYLTKSPDQLGREIAKFEVDYFSYLAGMTGGTIAALLALLFAERHVTTKQREVARYGIVALLLALSVVTLGYASRDLWVATEKALTATFATLDFWVLGPITGAAYIMGVVALVELAILQLMQDSANR